MHFKVKLIGFVVSLLNNSLTFVEKENVQQEEIAWEAKETNWVIEYAVHKQFKVNKRIHRLAGKKCWSVGK